MFLWPTGKVLKCFWIERDCSIQHTVCVAPRTRLARTSWTRLNAHEIAIEREQDTASQECQLSRGRGGGGGGTMPVGLRIRQLQGALRHVT